MIDLNSVFQEGCIALLTQCVGNQVMIPGGEELTIYEEPLIGFSSAEDELWSRSSFRSQKLSARATVNAEMKL